MGSMPQTAFSMALRESFSSSTPIGELIEKDARKAVERAVWGMLPKNRLGRQVLKKLKVYAGPDHPHAAQKAKTFEIKQVSQ